ncbi:MAG: aminoacyl-tRNA hydrolase, partial [Lachnospiraceae bacterium]|nr:aminoacyl-tRNA hydrolase [Lachnospiraceae bacterium]
ERVKFQAQIAKGVIGGEDVVLVRPLTYMNLSGNAIRAVMDFYKIAPENVIIIYDDIDTPFGNLRIRESGSAGGHNGMKSIVQQMGTQDFPRVRIGVGAKPEGWDLADYVLSKFSSEEKPVIAETEERAAMAAAAIIEKGLSKAMNLYNSKKGS